MEFTLKSDSCRLNDDAQDDCDSHVYVSVSEFLEMIATPDGELFDRRLDCELDSKLCSSGGSVGVVRIVILDLKWDFCDKGGFFVTKVDFL